MIRRGLIVLLAATVGFGLFAAYQTRPTRADSSYYISNISAGVSGNTVSYYACVFAPVAAEAGLVMVSTTPDGSGSQYQIGLSPAGGCGGSTYGLQGSATLPLGHYYFQAATAVLAPGGPFLPSVQRNVGLVSNFSGDTVASDCQVDVSTGSPQSPRNCTGPGVAGNLVGFGPPPPAPTNAPLPPDTPTITPPATSTPVPATAPNTPVPPTGPNTPVKSTTQLSVPTLRATLLAPLVQPGSVERIAVSYVENALVQASVTFPGAGARAVYSVTGARGHTTLAVTVPRTVILHHGRATAQVAIRAISGPWSRVATMTPVVHPGATRLITISTTPYTAVRAVVTIPGVRRFALFGTTGIRGHFTLMLTVPRTIKLSHGHATALVTVSAVTAQRQAQVTRALNISDMVLSVVSGPILSCRQVEMVHVAYHPNVPLRVLLLFPKGRRFSVTSHTGMHGKAVVRVQLHYVRAHSPIRIVVQARDATLGAHRMERTAVSVFLPHECQAQAPSTVTISEATH